MEWGGEGGGNFFFWGGGNYSVVRLRMLQHTSSKFDTNYKLKYVTCNFCLLIISFWQRTVYFFLSEIVGTFFLKRKDEKGFLTKEDWRGVQKYKILITEASHLVFLFIPISGNRLLFPKPKTNQGKGIHPSNQNTFNTLTRW